MSNSAVSSDTLPQYPSHGVLFANKRLASKQTVLNTPREQLDHLYEGNAEDDQQSASPCDHEGNANDDQQSASLHRDRAWIPMQDLRSTTNQQQAPLGVDQTSIPVHEFQPTTKQLQQSPATNQASAVMHDFQSNTEQQQAPFSVSQTSMPMHDMQLTADQHQASLATHLPPLSTIGMNSSLQAPCTRADTPIPAQSLLAPRTSWRQRRGGTTPSLLRSYALTEVSNGEYGMPRSYDGSAIDELEEYTYLSAAFGGRGASVWNTDPGLPPRPPSRTFRSSMLRMSRRSSLTSSEFGSPALQGDRLRAEEILGIRTYPPPPNRPSSVAPRAAAQGGEVVNGARAWIQAILAVLIVFNCWGFSNAFGLFQAYYQRDFIPGTPPGTISWIGSTQLALVFLLGVPLGQAVDNGYFRLIYHGGTIVMLAGILGSSFCTSFGSLLAVQGVITGIGMGCVFTSGLLALMTWFDERQMGLALALPAAGSSLGGIVYILLARTYLPRLGFPTTMRILFAVACGTMVLPTLMFHPLDDGHHYKRHHRQRFSFRIFVESAYLLAAAGLFFSFLGFYFGLFYLVTYSVEVLQLSDTASTNLLIAMLAVNLPGRLIPGFLSDRIFGPLNTMVPSIILSSVMIWIWIGSLETQTSVTVIACFYGFVSGGIQALYAAATYSFCLSPDGRVPGSVAQPVLDRVGFKAGGIFSCIGIAVLIGTPIGGGLVSYRLDRALDRPFLGAQIFAGVSLLLGACFLLASRIQKVGLAMERA